MDIRLHFAFYCRPSGARSRHFHTARQSSNSFPRIFGTATGILHVLIPAGLNGQPEQTYSRKRWFPTKRKGGSK